MRYNLLPQRWRVSRRKGKLEASGSPFTKFLAGKVHDDLSIPSRADKAVMLFCGKCLSSAGTSG